MAAGGLFFAAALAFAADVVVLKGGARIELKKPPVRQGALILLTRTDGTLLSIPATEVDWKATAAEGARVVPGRPAPAVTAPAETPAQAVRSGHSGPKAKIKLTDADVTHQVEEEPAAGEKKPGEPRTGAGRLEIAEYTQEKSENDLVVRGSLRNAGGTTAGGARMTVTALDEKGDPVGSGEATLSAQMIEPGATASFSAKIPVGEKSAVSFRFAPQWLASAPPAPAASPTPPPASAPAGAKGSASGPQVSPTPYGQGTLYAPPAAAASTTPPADGNRGYIPGMSSPENQPKPEVTPKS
jgi:hypothetical protein